jgi:hypothetical protein
VAKAIQPRVALQHGDRCTCMPLDQIEYTAIPVLVDDDCPSLGEKPRPVLDAGRVIITWPAATTAGVLPLWGVRLEDADSGEPLISGFKLVLGTDTGYEGNIIEAEVTALVDEDGQILAGSGIQPVPTEEYVRHHDAAIGLTGDARLLDEHNASFQGSKFRTGVFRYAVAEMRIADTASVAGSVENEYDLDTGARRQEPEE